ncbi:uncharacterized protein LOC128736310 [Sabethes cyaneus]|uniref:uncharacterized protein LOC128736310 n=1 Tax=Sabethes cyaneus TaxID=53552 RepID=UPI00237DDB39|nr:uncharacterized protein LOC128736310 [Sabethes cyaneus]
MDLDEEEADNSTGSHECNSQDEYIIEALDENYSEEDPLFDASYEENNAKPAKKRRKLGISIDFCDPSSSQLALRGVFYKRRFVGETSGSQFSSATITGNSLEEIMRGVWKVLQPVLCREVVFVDNNGEQVPTWADSDPDFCAMNKFVIMQDQAQKRRLTIDQIDCKLLVTWRGKEIRIHVHIYSNAVSCRSLWDLVDKQLIRFQNADRSGAPNNQSLTHLAKELQDLHGHYFTGHSSSWRLWANYIHSASPHERERRMSEMPPIYLLKFFRSAPLSEAIKLETTRSGLSVANTINDGFKAELAELEAEADQLIMLGQRVKQRISGLRSRSTVNATLVSAMSETLRPEENELSHTLADRIVDMTDIDHA